MSKNMPPSEGYKPMGQRMLAAIMFTDVAGFSRLMGEHEERTMHAVERDLRRITNLCEESSGRVLKIMGDGILALFYSAVRAVECAREIQRQFAEQAQALPPEDVLNHRIGIHLGDVYVHEDEVMGEGVNIAARLQAEAPPGGICISQALYEVVKRRLAIQTIHRGAKQLKNIKEEVHVYQILLGQGDGMQTHTAEVVASTRRRRIYPFLAGTLLLLIIAAVAYLGFSGRRSSGRNGGRDNESRLAPSVADTAHAMASQPATVEAESLTGHFEGAQAVPDSQAEDAFGELEREAGSAAVPEALGNEDELSAGRDDRSDPHSVRESPVPDPRVAFDRFDRNRDGKLSWSELPRRVRPEIMRADADRDRTVSWQEFIDAVRHRFGALPSRPDSLPKRQVGQ